MLLRESHFHYTLSVRKKHSTTRKLQPLVISKLRDCDFDQCRDGGKKEKKLLTKLHL